MGRILKREELLREAAALKKAGRRVVFTNGCFDLLHRGHVRYLTEARALGDVLVVGLNGDRSVAALKGAGRPIQTAEERVEILAALSAVDYILLFDELTPEKIITALRPDVLVKGGDWTPDQIVGRAGVEAHGGRVVALPYLSGSSTSGLIQRILDRSTSPRQ